MFVDTLKIASLLKKYSGTWMIAGGWAIDLYINKQTRSHHDIEIAIPRLEQQALRKYLNNWNFHYVKRGQFFQWRTDEYLNLPIHEIHGKGEENDSLEILLNEVKDDVWYFRRNQQVTYPVSKLILLSKQNIPILCPEVVLLYKAKINKEKDRLDLSNTLSYLTNQKKKWLREAIQETHGSHDWLQLI